MYTHVYLQAAVTRPLLMHRQHRKDLVLIPVRDAGVQLPLENVHMPVK